MFPFGNETLLYFLFAFIHSPWTERESWSVAGSPDLERLFLHAFFSFGNLVSDWSEGDQGRRCLDLAGHEFQYPVGGGQGWSKSLGLAQEFGRLDNQEFQSRSSWDSRNPSLSGGLPAKGVAWARLLRRGANEESEVGRAMRFDVSQGTFRITRLGYLLAFANARQTRQQKLGLLASENRQLGEVARQERQG